MQLYRTTRKLQERCINSHMQQHVQNANIDDKGNDA